MYDLGRWAGRIKRGEPLRAVTKLIRRSMYAGSDRFVRSGVSVRVVKTAEAPTADLHALQRIADDTVCNRLDGIPVLWNADVPRYPRHAMIRAEDARRALAAIDSLPSPWAMRPSTTGRGRVVRPCFRLDGQIVGDDVILPTHVDIMERDGDSYRSSALGGLARVTAADWDNLAAERQGARCLASGPSPSTPIDVVYTWVNGRDPAWQDRFDAALRDSGQSGQQLHPSSTDRVRFDDSEELRHSLRSVYQFANWARTIYIVTDGQVPDWLDASHPRIRVIDHQEIIGGSRFNSHAIEASLHRIDGLAENYLYLNDDVFFGRVAHPSDFFMSERVARFFPSDLPVDPGQATAADMPIMAAAKNGRDLLRRRFGAECTTRIRHTVHPQLRTINEQIEQENPEDISRVRGSLFRSSTDLSVAASLHHWYAFVQGRATPSSPNFRYVDIGSARAGRALDAIRARRAYDTFCLNFERSGDGDHQALQELRRFLADYFPHRAPWEIG